MISFIIFLGVYLFAYWRGRVDQLKLTNKLLEEKVSNINKDKNEKA